MIDKYALFGNPVKHSHSPYIHQKFAKQTEQILQYEKILISEAYQFRPTVTNFFQQGGKGANVTLPFKELAFQMADKLTERARCAGAVNTLMKLEDDSLLGDNTDGYGLVYDISHNFKFTITNKNILLLGAGGAARGVIKPLLDVKPQQLIIANRTINKAMQLAEEFKEYGNINCAGFSDLDSQFDLIIIATSASLKQESLNLPENIVKTSSFCYDMFYSASLTPFLEWGKQQNAAIIIDGLGMLVEQAAEAFYIWRGVRPETKRVYQKLRVKILGMLSSR